MRPDKVTLAATAATLALSRAGRAVAAIPVWRQIAAPRELLEQRARALAARVGGRAVAVDSTVGGGSLPGETLPSFGVALDGGADRLLAALRRGSPSIVGRIAEGSVILDLRTVEPERDDDLATAIRRATETAGVRR
jgi:L-seryl-tRNA(Ser) seleniumtransferase